MFSLSVTFSKRLDTCQTEMSTSRAQSAVAVLYPSRHLLALGSILLVGVGLRAAWLAYVNVDPNDGRFDDTLFYYNSANLLARGFGYITPYGGGEPTAQWPPGYTGLLALIYLLGGKSLFAVKALNVGLAMVSIVLTYLLASRLFDRRVGLLAALLLAAFPSYVYLSTLVMAENLFIPAFLLAVLLMVHWGAGGRAPKALQSLAVGAVIAFSALVRVEGLWLLAPALVVWLVASHGWARAVQQVLLVLVGAAVILTPWTVRNAIQLDEFILVRSASAQSLATGLNPDYKLYRKSLGLELPRPSLSETLRIHRDGPWRPFPLLGHKIHDLYKNDSEILLWVRGDGPNPSLTDEEFDRWGNIANAAYFWVGAVALLGLAMSLVKRNAGVLLLTAVVATWTLGFALFVPETRYHLPLLPLLSVFAAAPMVWLLPKAVTVEGLAHAASGEEPAPRLPGG